MVRTCHRAGYAVHPVGNAPREARRNAQLEAITTFPFQRCRYLLPMHLELVTIIVADYDPAITFFVDVLGFSLVEDVPATTNDGRAKRWVVVRPPGAVTGLLLARADGAEQAAAIGQQTPGRVGLFLRADDFSRTFERMCRAGVRFVSPPRVEPYGRVAVFLDIAGNRWDLLGPAGDEPTPTGGGQ